MDELEKKSLIEKKKEQIKLLEQEIRELKQPASIAAYVHNRMLTVCDAGDGFGYEIIKREQFSGPTWDIIRKLCLACIREKYNLNYGERLSVKSLKHEDVHICAEMAEELIEVWNRNVEKVYGGNEV